MWSAFYLWLASWLLKLPLASPTFWTGAARIFGCGVFVAWVVFGSPPFLAIVLGVILLADAAGHFVELIGGAK